MNVSERVFIGVFPCGISYSDRKVEEHGDYKKLAFIDYHTLTLKFYGNVPNLMRQYIIEHAADLAARKGERYEVSACGQTVLLGDGIK